jgi:hypothetical protein
LKTVATYTSEIEQKNKKGIADHELHLCFFDIAYIGLCNFLLLLSGHVISITLFTKAGN